MHNSMTSDPYLFSEPTVTGGNYKRMPRHYATTNVLDLSAFPIFKNMMLVHLGQLICKGIWGQIFSELEWYRSSDSLAAKVALLDLF